MRQSPLTCCKGVEAVPYRLTYLGVYVSVFKQFKQFLLVTDGDTSIFDGLKAK